MNPRPAAIDTGSMAPAAPSPPVLLALLPIMVAVLISFFTIGVALPVLPLHVRGLGFGPFIVGLVAGSQFAASLVSRVWAGRTCDERGPKRAVVMGLVGATLAGLFYLGSLPFVGQPVVSVVILLAGRAVLGAAESFIITGATVWGLGRVGARHAGKVIAWMGTAMFAAFAAGAPAGIAVYQQYGFRGVAAITAAAPLLTLLLVAPLRPITLARHAGVSMLSVVRAIWLPGLGAALSSVGFGAVLSFASLLYAERGWTPIWLAFTAYAVALIIARTLFGHLPDKIGGAKIAIGCVVIEAVGLGLIGLGSSAILAAIGAALTGFGYALVYPGLGVEAVRRAPAESRGLAMGAYTACLDIALAVSGPGLGLVAAGAGLGAAFDVSAVVVLGAGVVAARLLKAAPPVGRSSPASTSASETLVSATR